VEEVQDVGSLSRLVGAVTNVPDWSFNVYPGTVAVVLRNGKPVRVRQPGGSWRAFNMPLLGKIDAVPVSTEYLTGTFRFEHVQTSDSMPLQSMSITAKFRIDDSDDYAGLLAYVGRAGTNFAELIEPEFRQSLDEMVRSIVVGFTHQQLYSMGALTQLFPVPRRLMDGLFRIESVLGARPEWHRAFVEAQQIRIETDIELTRKAAEVEVEVAEGSVSTVRDARLAQEALRRGRTLDEYERPELVSAREDRRHEAEMAALSAQTEIIKAALENPRLAGRFRPEDLGQFLGGAALGVGRGSSSDAEPDPESEPEPVIEFHVSERLREIWDDVGFQRAPAGGGWKRTADRVVALVVDDEVAEDADRQSRLHDAIVAESGGRTVDLVVVGASGGLSGVVSEYLATRLPELRSPKAEVEIGMDSDDVVIDVTIHGGRSATVRRAIDDPMFAVSEPLESLIGRGVRVVAHGGD
jgi:hypothetical protein